MAEPRTHADPKPRKTPAKKAAAPKVEAPVEVVEEVRPKVYFVANTHTSGTTTPSGATFSFSPGVSVKVSHLDAVALVAQGVGSIQGG